MVGNKNHGQRAGALNLSRLWHLYPRFGWRIAALEDVSSAVRDIADAV